MTRGFTPAYRPTANYTRIECVIAAKFVTRVRGPARFLKLSPPHSRCLLRCGSAHPSVRFLRAIRAQRPLSRPDVRSAFWRPQTDRQLHDLEIVQQRERFLAPCDLESEGRARRRIEGPHRSIHKIMRIAAAATATDIMDECRVNRRSLRTASPMFISLIRPATSSAPG